MRTPKLTVGISIYDTEIRAVSVECASHQEIKALKGRVIPHGTIEDGRVKNARLVSLYIGELVRDVSSGREPDRVVVNIPDENVFIHRFVVKEKEEREPDFFKEIVQNEAQNYVPLSHEMVLTYHILSREKTSGFLLYTIVFCAVEKRVLEEWEKIFIESGLREVIFTVEAETLHKAFLRDKKEISKDGILLVVLKNKSTRLFLYDQKGVVHTHAFSRDVGAVEGGDDTSEDVKRTVREIKETLTLFRRRTHGVVRTILLLGNRERATSFLPVLQKQNLETKIILGEPSFASQQDVLDAGGALGGAVGACLRNMHLVFPSRHVKRAPRLFSLKAPHSFLFSWPRAWVAVAILPLLFFFSFMGWGNLFLKTEKIYVTVPERPEKSDTDSLVPKQGEEIASGIPARGSTALIKETPTGWLNVREGPGTEYEIIQHVFPGEGYPLIGEQDEWIKIDLGDAIGWVNRDYVILE